MTGTEPLLGDREFRSLLERCNRPWSGYRKVRKGIIKKIRRHMRTLGCSSLDPYLDILTNRQMEYLVLEDILAVTISRFFRDRSLWTCLQHDVVPELLALGHTPLAVWSAGCAAGEEAYSLAIMGDSMGVAESLDILATDRKPRCLDRARRGIFTAGSLREVDDHLVGRYFDKTDDHSYAIKSELSGRISWRSHDLFSTPPHGPFHLILLRNNLLTYHQGEQLENALLRILSVLHPRGYLAIGCHERLPPGRYGLVSHVCCPYLFCRSTETVQNAPIQSQPSEGPA